MVNYIIDVISALLKKKFVDEVKETGIFSVQLDATQDIS